MKNADKKSTKIESKKEVKAEVKKVAKKEKKAEKKPKADRKPKRSFGASRVEWYNGIVSRLIKRLENNGKKIDKEVSKVKDDKDAVKALNEIKSSINTAITNLKKA